MRLLPRMAMLTWLIIALVLGHAGMALAGHPLPAALHPGLEVFTRERQSNIAADAIGLRFTGFISYPLAENLTDLLLGTPQRYNHVVLELDSEGGELSYIKSLVEVLKRVKERTEFTTRVLGGGIRASGCIALFMQGGNRKASGASVWIFHGAHSLGSNVRDTEATEGYLALLRDAGVTHEFLAMLTEHGYVTRPGNLFLSGHELFQTYRNGIITELLPAWQPDRPILPAGSPQR